MYFKFFPLYINVTTTLGETCSWCCGASWHPSFGWRPTSSPSLRLVVALPWTTPPGHQTWCVRAHHTRCMTPLSHLLYSPTGSCQSIKPGQRSYSQWVSSLKVKYLLQIIYTPLSETEREYVWAQCQKINMRQEHLLFELQLFTSRSNAQLKR